MQINYLVHGCKSRHIPVLCECVGFNGCERNNEAVNKLLFEQAIASITAFRNTSNRLGHENGAIRCNFQFKTLSYNFLQGV